jgi:DNA-directed RNA polymerase subunit N (RpoN/RPB10)
MTLPNCTTCGRELSVRYQAYLKLKQIEKDNDKIFYILGLDSNNIHCKIWVVNTVPPTAYFDK